jgi:phosphohistidine phosphatase
MASFGTENNDALFDYATTGPAPAAPPAAPPADGFTTNAEDQAAAAAMRSGSSSSDDAAGQQLSDAACEALFPAVQIDEGTFKYVLIETTRTPGGSLLSPPRLLVRGHVGANYHKDAARATTQALALAGWEYTVLGGGRIRHAIAAKEILVYGHSYGFPWGAEGSRHADTVEVLKRKFPDYASIAWTDEGY